MLSFTLSVFLGSSAEAQKKSPSVKAVVVTDGAQIYAKPDFDANVIGSLKAGKSVTISRGKIGEFAKFHKIKSGKVTGYIADIDVRSGALPAPQKKKFKDAKARDKQASNKTKEKDPTKDPLYFSRFFGLTLGSVIFKEGISGVDSKANLVTYGFRVTGPDVIMSGAVIDWNLILHYGAPSYYNSLSSTTPGGFVLWTDAHFLLPFFGKHDAMGYFGIGPMLAFSSFKLTNGGEARDLTALNIGLSTSLGGAFRFGKYAVRLEGKYFIEKQAYPGLQLSLQSPL
ncbi:MAG: SH3 domain-containing protein [Bdellovibrionota bacterium]